MEFDRKDIEMNKLVATTLESKIHVFDMKTQHQEKGFASVVEKVKKITFEYLFIFYNQRLIIQPFGLVDIYHKIEMYS